MASSLISTGVFCTAFLAAFFSVLFFKQNFKRVVEEVDLQACEILSTGNIRGECLFRSNYSEARKLFLKSANDAGAEMMFLPVVDDLGTDVAILRGSSKKFILHISGTHGIEGYAGSAIQSAALQYLLQQRKIYSNETDDLPTIIFVHALNPYGFANDRRVNEKNVDLNRNFLSEDEFAALRARDPNYVGYVNLNSLFNPVKTISTNIHVNEAYSLLRTAYALGRYGLLHIKRALVAGNYHKMDGVGFGGFDLQQSAKNLISLVEDESIGLMHADQILLLDVHTGLGPIGVDTLGSNKDSTLQKSFPTETETATTESSISAIVGGIHADLSGKGTKDDALSGYDLTVGQITTAFCDNWLSKNISRDKVTCLLQEFGTVRPSEVGRYMIAENFAYFHGSQEEKAYYREKYRDCFYVQTSFWKRRVVRRGLKVIIQSLNFLGADPQRLPFPNYQL